MELKKDVKLKLEVEDYHGFRFGWMTNGPTMTVQSNMYMGWTTPFSGMRCALYPDKIKSLTIKS